MTNVNLRIFGAVAGALALAACGNTEAPPMISASPAAQTGQADVGFVSDVNMGAPAADMYVRVWDSGRGNLAPTVLSVDSVQDCYNFVAAHLSQNPVDEISVICRSPDYTPIASINGEHGNISVRSFQ